MGSPLESLHLHPAKPQLCAGALPDDALEVRAPATRDAVRDSGIGVLLLRDGDHEGAAKIYSHFVVGGRMSSGVVGHRVTFITPEGEGSKSFFTMIRIAAGGYECRGRHFSVFVFPQE